MQFIKNKMSFTPNGSYMSGSGGMTKYYWGIRGDGVFLSCVNEANLQKATGENRV